MRLAAFSPHETTLRYTTTLSSEFAFEVDYCKVTFCLLKMLVILTTGKRLQGFVPLLRSKTLKSSPITFYKDIILKQTVFFHGHIQHELTYEKPNLLHP